MFKKPYAVLFAPLLAVVAVIIFFAFFTASPQETRAYSTYSESESYSVFVNYYRDSVDSGNLLPSGPEIYVSPDGDDRNSGDIDYPLKSLLGARNKIRGMKEMGGLPQGGVTVYFRGGQYNMTKTVEFTEEDSGTENSPITYAAYPGETPLFTGGLYFSGSQLSPV
ncbi:MAG: hypothetical protein LBH91_00590, partial [Prevotellaceae bacterium]|nr:hypothetical protein [Prevotellaceae bacterium]